METKVDEQPVAISSDPANTSYDRQNVSTSMLSYHTAREHSLMASLINPDDGEGTNNEQANLLATNNDDNDDDEFGDENKKRSCCFIVNLCRNYDRGFLVALGLQYFNAGT